MGINTSKSEAQAASVPRKSLRSRSSLNLLKRTRTSSNAATKAQTRPLEDYMPVAEDEDKIEEVVMVPRPDQPSHLTYIESFSGSPPDRDLHHSPLSSVGEDRYDASDTDTNTSEASSYSTRPYTPVNIERDALSMSGSEDSRTGTPALSLTPKTRPTTLLPQPSMLPEDSPTKYGLRDMPSPAPDIALLTQAQRKKMTGPGLFARAAEQLKDYHSARDFDPDRRAFSHSSPCLLKHGIAQKAPVWSSRRGSCGNLLSDGAPARYRVVHALPMLASQLDCFHQHDEWHAASQPGYNVSNPVSCSVCDGYNPELAGDDFRRCDWCWLIVCGKCYDAFLRDGVEALMNRQAGTPDTGSSAVSSRE